MDQPSRLVVTLNTLGVLAPAHRSIRDTVDVVTFCLNAIEQGDLSDWARTDRMRFTLRFPDEISAEQRKAAYTHWLLSKGFQECISARSDAVVAAAMRYFGSPGNSATS